MSDDTPHVSDSPTPSELEGFLLEFPSEGSASAPDGASARQAASALGGASARQAASEPAAPIAPSVVVDAPVKPTVPATVTEFPVHATRPPASSVAALAPTSPQTLLELLDRHGGLDWRRAVSVVHQVCLQLRGQSSHAPILLEARNILLTNDGEVLLLPSQPGGDPLVIQLGRLLRTLLRGNEAPPELRLLLAQATFELPIFESVDEVDRALRQLDKLEEDPENGKGFIGPVVMPPAPEPIERIPARPAQAPRPFLPKPQAPTGRRKRSSRDGVLYAYGLQVALALVVVAIATSLLLRNPHWLWPDSPVRTSAAPASGVATVEPPAAPATRPADPPVEVEPTRGSNRATVLPAPVLPAPPLSTARPAAGRARSTPRLETAVRNAKPPAASTTTSNGSAPVATVGAASPRESQRRATALIAQGQTAEAGIVFDSLLLSNPLYEPNPTELTPEALATFRTSQRLLLPNIAQRDYDRGRAALSAGDPDRALSLGKEAAAILDRRVSEQPPQLRDQVQRLVEEATTAKTAADEIVYTANDKGVIPPRELSRQFPMTPPIGVPPQRVGTLDMIIGRDGSVEYVHLITPLNRYHERMIVSAAKAWRYRPATRSGKPVRFHLTVKINLPESGTDY
jgi:hypothetical protein